MNTLTSRIQFISLLLLAVLALASMPVALAVDPPPDGGYPGGNTAEGDDALLGLTTGEFNTALGNSGLFLTTSGSDNTGTGYGVMARNTTGSNNTANGVDTLFSNTTGSQNTAIGFYGLFSNTTGNNNIAVGFQAGYRSTGDNNIDIGNQGAAGDSGVIRIGTAGTQRSTTIAGISGVTVADGVTVMIDPRGRLGTVGSSARYKEAIQPMGKASEALLALKPVTFHYKKDLDPKTIPQFGLVAEQVAKVDPDLVAKDDEGKPYTVRYEAVNAMLLNEFLKEHRKVEEQGAEIAELRSALKKQAAQIERVNERLESIPPAPRLVKN